MGLKYELTTNEEVFNASELPKINYSNKNLTGGIHILPHVMLFEYGIKDYFIEVNQHESYFKYFFKNAKGDVPFDVLAASFWLLSRYEEYLPFTHLQCFYSTLCDLPVKYLLYSCISQNIVQLFYYYIL